MGGLKERGTRATLEGPSEGGREVSVNEGMSSTGRTVSRLEPSNVWSLREGGRQGSNIGGQCCEVARGLEEKASRGPVLVGNTVEKSKKGGWRQWSRTERQFCETNRNRVTGLCMREGKGRREVPRKKKGGDEGPGSKSDTVKVSKELEGDGGPGRGGSPVKSPE